MNIDDLIDELLKKTYKTKYSSGYGYYDSRLISGEEAQAALKNVIYDWASKQVSSNDMNKKLGELEAKVYAYEKIIANSNFKPVLIVEDENGKGKL